MRLHQTDQLEAINAPQLATATDRLLVLGLPRRRQLARGSYTHLEVPTVVVAAAPVRQSHRARYAVVLVLAVLLGFTTTRIAIAQHDATQISHR